MNRLIAYSFLLIGFIYLGDAVYDEQRGIASVIQPSGATSASFQPSIAKRDEDPKLFRSLMNYQWVRAPLILFLGYILLRICRRADRTDPFSPDFAGNDTLDELNRTLTDEQRKRDRPLR